MRHDDPRPHSLLLSPLELLARHHIRLALTRWKRRTRIVSAQGEWTRLVAEQRLYLLRKLVLTAHWQRVALAFEKWCRVIRSFTRVAQRAAALCRKQLTRLAWAKWRRVLRSERLEEEAAAWRCVLWTRKADRVVARIVARCNKERLMDAWLAWKIWYRRERCKTWRRGMSMAARRYFVAWQRHYFAARSERARLKTTVREIVGSMVDDAFAQCLWRQNLRDLQREDDTRRILSVLHRWSILIQRQRLAQAFELWQFTLTAPDTSVQDEVEPTQTPTVRAQTFPERFTAAYREQRRTATTKPASSYRRSWR